MLPQYCSILSLPPTTRNVEGESTSLLQRCKAAKVNRFESFAKIFFATLVNLARECFFGVPPLNTKLNQAIHFLSQCGHNASVKVNLKTIGKEKNSADLLSVFVQQTLATASTRQGSQVQILSHPPFFQHSFFLCHNRVTTKKRKTWLRSGNARVNGRCKYGISVKTRSQKVYCRTRHE